MKLQYKKCDLFSPTTLEKFDIRYFSIYKLFTSFECPQTINSEYIPCKRKTLPLIANLFLRVFKFR